jgi:hypothetical protein
MDVGVRFFLTPPAELVWIALINWLARTSAAYVFSRVSKVSWLTLLVGWTCSVGQKQATATGATVSILVILSVVVYTRSLVFPMLSAPF